MFARRLIIALFTFPGVVLHEMAHLWFCRLFGVHVYKVCYFRFGNPAGYVVYEPPESTYKHILICVGPFLVNTAVGVGAAFHCSLLMFPSGRASLPDYMMLWLGLSIASHAFPSTGDARSIWRALWRRGAPILARLIGVPLVGVIYLGILASYFRLDIIYGALMIYWLPRFIMRIIA